MSFKQSRFLDKNIFVFSGNIVEQENVKTLIGTTKVLKPL